ncbi:MAG TPA: OPT family oligopeptide transporter [Polyangiaceae bacterium]|nr:OPT family oligopeptide transporter [Polyangiaceae bacterium]
MTHPENISDPIEGGAAAGSSADPSTPRAGEAPLDAGDDETRRAREWLANVYVGDRVPQLTLRSVLTGMVLGGVMALSNLYVGMKTGWSLGVTITASILAYAMFSGLQRVVPRLRRNEFTILENNMMASVASAAGYMAGSIFVSAVPALYLCSGATVPGFQLAFWACAVSFLGVFMAIPMKRQQIDIDQLPFPTGLATAETLRAMHDRGGDATSKAIGLSAGALLGAIVGWMREAHARWMPFNLPSMWTPAGVTIAGQPLQRLTIGADLSLIMIGAGAIIGLRVGTSLLIAAIVCYGILGPWVLGHDPAWIDPNRYRQTWALWPGVGLLAASGLTMFLLRWRTIGRAFTNLRRAFGPARTTDDDPLRGVEAPQSWFVVGTLVSGLACVLLGHWFFGISWWMGILAVLVTFFLALVASRATGETDITPTGAMGKITQLMYGLIAPGNMTVNLMTASLTGGAAIHTADLLTDLKSGYILGANPRKQLIAQLFGVIAGTLFVVPGYLLLVKPEEIGSDRWPAPAAQIWAGVARVLAQGLDALPPGAQSGLLIGAAVGVVLALIEDRAPKHLKKYTLSSTAVGIAFVIPAWNSISMFVGGLLAWVFARLHARKAEKYSLSVAAGFIAGESLIAVLVAALVAMHVLQAG